jgi:hypothetical protein
MTSAQRTTGRWLTLGALAVFVLALILSLTLFVGRGGCTPAVALDRRIEPEARARRPLELDSGVTTRTTNAAADDEERAGRRRDPAVDPSSTVSGFVTDVVTNEIVPEVEVELTLESRSDRIAVGQDGAFTSTIAFPSGDLRAIVRDDGVEVGRATVRHDAAKRTRGWRVEVPIGPTVPIATIDGTPFDPATWRVRIRESALDDEVVGEIDVGAEGLSNGAGCASAPAAGLATRARNSRRFQGWRRARRCAATRRTGTAARR